MSGTTIGSVSHSPGPTWVFASNFANPTIGHHEPGVGGVGFVNQGEHLVQTVTDLHVEKVVMVRDTIPKSSDAVKLLAELTTSSIALTRSWESRVQAVSPKLFLTALGLLFG
nr:hypothetical protein [Brevibacterium aurantiacum]